MSKIIGNIDNISVTGSNGNIREIVCKIDMSAFHKRSKYKQTHTRGKKSNYFKVKEKA